MATNPSQAKTAGGRELKRAAAEPRRDETRRAVVESDRQTFVKKVGCCGGKQECQAVVVVMMESSIVGQRELAHAVGRRSGR